MSNNERHPPTFLTIFLKSWRRTTDAHWIVGKYPFFLFSICFVAPAFLTSMLSTVSNTVDDTLLITSISAFMVLSGFLGGFSINAMTQIQTVSSTYPFSSYLRDEGLFDEFIFFPQFTIGIQIVAIMVQCISIVFVLYLSNSVGVFILFFNIFVVIYMITKTWQLVNLIRVLTWHYEHYMRAYHEFNEQGPK